MNHDYLHTNMSVDEMEIAINKVIKRFDGVLFVERNTEECRDKGLYVNVPYMDDTNRSGIHFWKSGKKWEIRKGDHTQVTGWLCDMILNDLSYMLKVKIGSEAIEDRWIGKRYKFSTFKKWLYICYCCWMPQPLKWLHLFITKADIPKSLKKFIK